MSSRNFMDDSGEQPTIIRRIIETITVAGIYFLLGKLGQELAIPPGTVTLVWPPSGFALAMLLLYGRRMWLGVFWGAMAVNTLGLSGQSAEAPVVATVVIGISIGIGSVLQPLLGTVLIQRYIGEGGLLEKAKNTLTFAAIIPAMCLVSATVGASSLYFAGLVDTAHFAELWLTWWLGDGVGILIITPLLLAWCKRWKFPRNSKSLPMLLVIFTMLTMSGLVSFGALFGEEGNSYPLQFLAWPFLLWLALRFNERAVTSGLLLLACIAIWQTVDGRGPYYLSTPYLSLLLLQLYIVVSVLTVTVITALANERNQAENAMQIAYSQVEGNLRERETWLSSILKNSPVYVALRDIQGRYLAVSRNYPALLGMREDELIGRTNEDVLPRRIAEILVPADKQVLDTGLSVQRQLHQRVNGSDRHFMSERFPLEDADGRITGICGISSDITEIKKVQEGLGQAQKMEAVGQLTGGIAHDFNNILAVIQGNAELFSPEAKNENAQVQAILRATQRGAELSQRLLAFSRRQQLRPQPLDLAKLVLGMTDLLTRTLGATIDIETIATAGILPVMADSGQVENALLNLAINARDAMPDGGKLTIECHNVHLDGSYVALNPEAKEGHYGVLTVTDDGSGMPADVKAQVFEPFFTTKEVGRGSGLGLSMVYGFAKQSGGHVDIYSEEGKGTTVKLYLPCAEENAALEKSEPSSDLPKGGGETILVIEDDENVREMACGMLERLGYQVTAAVDAADARPKLAQEDDFDLVLSDVVLPGGVSGPEFADEVRRDYPNLPIIFMSGYPAEAAMRNGFVGSDRVLLNKPFNMAQLAQALNAALGK